MRTFITFFRQRKFFILALLLQAGFHANAQQVTEVTTDFAGFWKSGVGALNATHPNTSHNVLSFKYNTVVYSTGVDDAKLTANGITHTAGDFKAFPVATVGGTVVSGASIYIALASRYDGVANGYSNPLPTLKIKDVLIDGAQGLDIGTGATNIPAAALISFPISSVTSAAISDAKPDILVSQIAQPTSTGDTLYFVNSVGAVVGNKIAINWTSITALGTYYLDLYTLPTGALCDTARINGTADKETTRDIRLLALRLSDFGITTGNSTTVTGFVLRASGSSDPAFIAYNADAFTIPAPVITVQPVSQVVCPNVSNSATFTVTATGGSLSYQWRKNNVDIAGATNASYTIANVTTASAGAYNVIVSNPVGSVASDIVYLNTSIAVQPTPTTQLIATGAVCSLSVSANNATSYQWRKSGVDISGATSAAYIINPMNFSDSGTYSVQIINSGGSGCANLISTNVVVTPSAVLYSKASGNLNLPATWGVVSDGSGSSPVNFTRPEHTFIVKNNAATGGNLTIAGTLDVANAVVTITANTTLDAKKIIRSGTGSLSVLPTSGLTVRDTSNLFFKTGNNVLKTLAVHGGNVALLNALTISADNSGGVVTLNGGTLNTGGNLTLNSNSTGTARLAALSGGAVINGAVTIERYLPAARGWRYLSVPLNASGAPTISQAWQEGVTTASGNPNPNPGYGGHIMGGTTGSGFDQSPTNNPSIKIYNNSSNSFVRLPATAGTNIPITNYPAYCVYFRGDRSINPMQGLSASITATILRMKGELKTGNQAVSVNASNFSFVGNPYPSPIDFGTLTRSNVKNTAYIWDPKMAGAYGLGGYVTLSWNNTTNSYDKTTSVSPVSRYIQSGEAFLVCSADNLNPGTLTFKESDKTNGGSDLVYRTENTDQRVRINLYTVNADDSLSLLDGILTTFADDNQNAIDNDDAKKLYGSNQSINIKRDAQMLAIERRKTITENDTTFLSIYQMKPQDYKLEIITGNMHERNIIAVLKDTYSAETNNTILDMNGTTFIPFTVNSDVASYAVNRFSIVFEAAAVVPVRFTAVQAKQSKTDVNVNWQTENEMNVHSYEVETSASGIIFTKVAGVPAKASNGTGNTYSWVDVNVTPGAHYYRIKLISANNEIVYSPIRKVAVNEIITKEQLSVSPNLVTGASTRLESGDLEKGNYTICIYNFAGQLWKKQTLQHNGGVLNYVLTLNRNMPPGKYEIKLTGDKIVCQTGFIRQ